MALLDRIAVKAFSSSSVGQSSTWTQPNHWAQPLGTWSSLLRHDIDFDDAVDKCYKANGPVFACILARLLPFSEARFQMQEMVDGRPGRLFNDPSLALLENPWPNATTGDLLARMEQKASLAGNHYSTVVGNGPTRRIRELHPSGVTIVTGSTEHDIDPRSPEWDLNAEIIGYLYRPPGSTRPPTLLTPGSVSHYAPIPDPLHPWRGMSWLTPIVRDIEADSAMTAHKSQFFKRGAQLNVVVKYDKSIKPAEFERYVELFDLEHAGTGNAYKTLHLGGGADATVIGNDLKSIDFKAVQGASETRIAAASGVGAIIARFSEGLAGSSLNSGNYAAAKRQMADMTLRPLWRNAAGSLAKFVDVPKNARHWYDVRDIEFLKEDRKDAAGILATSATTIRTLVDTGYDPDAVIDAVEAGDLSRLEGRHSGLYSVQLQAAGSTGGTG
jgi:phage portal protein BeeE